MDSETAEDIKRHFDFAAEGLRTGFAELRTEFGTLRIEVGGLRTEIADVKRHADVIAEGLRSDIRTVVEGVAGLDQKFTLEFVRVRDEIREQIGEVKSLLRVSYSDLDRRLHSLEKNRPS
ncbi:MAG TPA: hypothetical protein VF999_01770 [Thermoanaerobaculia bacterium]